MKFSTTPASMSRSDESKGVEEALHAEPKS